MMTIKTTGTKEWAAYNVNIQRGCEHGCRYCYARHIAVERFGRCTAEQWLNPVIDNRKVDKSYKKRQGVVMFPSSHDVTPLNLSQYLCVLHKLLDAGNQVLIVSKPHRQCITTICEAYREYKEQILFRFTIGSMSNAVLKFWEPNAPSFKERRECLKYAYYSGFNTSVSAEPFLDGRVKYLYEELKPWITDSFWIGKLRNLKRRVDMSIITLAEKAIYVRVLQKYQTNEAIRQLHRELNGQPFIKWKDSIREIEQK